jgi:hypothetical protein
MDCFVDPVQEYDADGTVRSAVFMRDNACTAGSTILQTLATGAAVHVVGETDGWYYIEYNGTRGWVGSSFLDVSGNGTGKSWSSSHEYMSANPSRSVTVTPPLAPPVSTPYPTDPALTVRLHGYVLLQVESHGEAWYVNPAESKRIYMKDGATAYQMMRSFGLGITDADLSRIPAVDTTDVINGASSICASNSLANKLKGRILLQVQRHGEAYYVYPKNCRMIYMKDGAAAYGIMRYLGLGITDADLEKIPGD